MQMLGKDSLPNVFVFEANKEAPIEKQSGEADVSCSHGVRAKKALSLTMASLLESVEANLSLTCEGRGVAAEEFLEDLEGFEKGFGDGESREVGNICGIEAVVSQISD